MLSKIKDILVQYLIPKHKGDNVVTMPIEKLSKKDESSLTKIEHLAIIMDGNGRWAVKRGLPRYAGHRFGAQNLDKIANYIYDNEICSTLTIFAFSTENWKRSKIEIKSFMSLIKEYLKTQADNLYKKGIKVRFIGDLTPFPEDLKQQLHELEQKTAKFTKLTFNIALNYGGRLDVIEAIKKMCDYNPHEITYDLLKQHLMLSEEPDLVIRTGGEQRLSNFLLLQSAYSELYFDETLWPDYTTTQLLTAVNNYQSRSRRFGGEKSVRIS